MRIDAESVEEWLAHPITEALMKGLAKEEGRLREQWLAASFDGGNCDPIELAKFRERYSAYRDIRAITAEKIEELHE